MGQKENFFLHVKPQKMQVSSLMNQTYRAPPYFSSGIHEIGLAATNCPELCFKFLTIK